MIKIDNKGLEMNGKAGDLWAEAAYIVTQLAIQTANVGDKYDAFQALIALFMTVTEELKGESTSNTAHVLEQLAGIEGPDIDSEKTAEVCKAIAEILKEKENAKGEEDDG